MPEGPEVRVIGDSIAKAIGHNIVRATYTQNKKYKWKRDGIPGWDKLESLRKRPWKVEDVIIKGKLIRVDIIDGEDELSMLSTLGLEGFWCWNLSASDKRAKHKRIWFDFDHDQQLAYYDSRNFGTLRIVNRIDADKKLTKIGWDLVVSPMPDKDWNALQKDKTMSKKPVGEVLMKQNHFSGIGNIYKAETLHTLGIHPSILVEDLDPSLWNLINHTAHQIMDNSYQVKGSSVKSYTGGSFQRSLKVYKKKDCPLGHPVMSLQQSKRTTWYCPTCQQVPTCITPSAPK